MLDLDETLIHASSSELDRRPDFTFSDYFLYRRPYLDEFLIDCNKYFDLAIWSSASGDYVREVVQKIVPPSICLRLVWDRSYCVRKIKSLMLWESSLAICLKDLNKKSVKKKLRELGFSKHKILIVDDDPRKLRRNYGNAIYVKEFNADPNDRELLLLKAYLKTLHDVEDVCRIEKRHWREKVLNNKQTEVRR
jgi:RNA polymerase II subunit A small phosphatase-like protein